MPEALASQTRTWIATHAGVLEKSVMALTYFDVHFDNLIVQGTKLAALLDLELLDVTSIDFTLDIARRMKNEPTKYASEAAKPFIKPEDYAHLLDWYREFYPEVFDFPDLETRLSFYELMDSIEHMSEYPHHEKLKDRVRKVVA